MCVFGAYVNGIKSGHNTSKNVTWVTMELPNALYWERCGPVERNISMSMRTDLQCRASSAYCSTNQNMH